MTKVGYARVSTKGQDLGDQVEQLKKLGISKDWIFSEKYTGKTSKRPEFQEMLSQLRRDDELYVTKLDRIGRNMRECLDIIEDLTNKGIVIIAGNLGRFDDTPTSKANMQMLLMFAELERNMIIERTQAGKNYAKKHNPNYREGRKPIDFSKDKRRQTAYGLMKSHTQREVAEMTGYSISTVKRIKKQGLKFYGDKGDNLNDKN